MPCKKLIYAILLPHLWEMQFFHTRELRSITSKGLNLPWSKKQSSYEASIQAKPFGALCTTRAGFFLSVVIDISGQNSVTRIIFRVPISIQHHGGTDGGFCRCY